MRKRPPKFEVVPAHGVSFDCQRVEAMVPTVLEIQTPSRPALSMKVGRLVAMNCMVIVPFFLSSPQQIYN